MSAEFRDAFANEGITRREWRLLSTLDASTPNDRLRGPKLRRLADRGWITRERDGWILTDSGTAAQNRLGSTIEGIRAKATDAVDPDELATTMATLEKLAVAYGWDAERPLPRRTGFHGRRFGGRGHDHSRHVGGHHERFQHDHRFTCGSHHRHEGQFEGHRCGHGNGEDRAGRTHHGFAREHASQDHPHCDHGPKFHGHHQDLPRDSHRGFGRGRG